jgi:hypothetical protein
MKKAVQCLKAGLLYLAVAGSLRAAPAPTFRSPEPPQCQLHHCRAARPRKKQLTGQETLVWKNLSGDAVGELQFHLYLNAFKNSRSTFMRESDGQVRGAEIDETEEDSWGWTDIKSLRVRNSAGAVEDLTPGIAFIHPDDNNQDDQSVIRVPLRQPVLPGASVTVEMEFQAKLPKILARTGFAGRAPEDRYFLVAQWFPQDRGVRGRRPALRPAGAVELPPVSRQLRVLRRLRGV